MFPLRLFVALFAWGLPAAAGGGPPARDPAPVGPTVVLPATLSGQPGVPIPVTAVATGKNVLWYSPDPGLVVVDGAFFGGDTKKALLFGPAGTYRLLAATAQGDTISPLASCIVTIAAPTPPGPPTPPPPPAPPPSPTDPLVQALRDAYAADATPSKAALAAKLAAYYDAAQKVCRGTVSTYGDLAAQLTAAQTAAGISSSDLPGVHAVLRPRLAALFPPGDTSQAVTSSQLDAAAKLFALGSVALKGVK